MTSSGFPPKKTSLWFWLTYLVYKLEAHFFGSKPRIHDLTRISEKTDFNKYKNKKVAVAEFFDTKIVRGI